MVAILALRKKNANRVAGRIALPAPISRSPFCCRTEELITDITHVAIDWDPTNPPIKLKAISDILS